MQLPEILSDDYNDVVFILIKWCGHFGEEFPQMFRLVGVQGRELFIFLGYFACFGGF